MSLFVKFKSNGRDSRLADKTYRLNRRHAQSLVEKGLGEIVEDSVIGDNLPAISNNDTDKLKKKIKTKKK